MMFLPAPYKDEMPFSVFARYMIQTGQTKFGRVMRQISNIRLPHSTCLPTSLCAISEGASGLWNKTGSEIAETLTLYPYYARYLTGERAKCCLNKMLSGTGSGIQLMLGIVSRRVKMPRYLRLCRICSKKDIALYGETYWRRCHQLPGVLVCPDHGVELIETTALTNPTCWNDCADATLVAVDMETDNNTLNEDDQRKALMIAQRSREMLEGPIKNWSSESINLAYRTAALKMGFMSGAYIGAISQLERNFTAFYGKSLLCKLGCDFCLDRNTSWLRNIFRSCHKPFHPLEHVLVQLFLENVSPNSAGMPPFGWTT